MENLLRLYIGARGRRGDDDDDEGGAGIGSFAPAPGVVD